MKEVEEDPQGPGLSSQGVSSILFRYGVSCAGVRAKVALWAFERVYPPFCNEVAQFVTETASEICCPQPLPKSLLESCPGSCAREPRGFVSASLFPSYARLYRLRVGTFDTKPHRGVLSFSSNIRYPIILFCHWNPIWLG
jgi:hypothetical protein